MPIKFGVPSFIMTSVIFLHHDLCHFSPEMLLYLSRNGTVKYSLLYECVDYLYFINSSQGKVHLIRDKLVHFPLEKRRNGGKINIFGGKVHLIRGKTVHFPGLLTPPDWHAPGIDSLGID